MRVRSPRLIILVVCAALVVLFIAALGLARLVTRPSVQVAWNAPGSDFSPSDKQSIKDHLGTALQSAGQSTTGSFTFTIAFAQRQGDQAIMSITLSDRASGTVIAGEPLFAIAHHQSSDWTVWVPGSPGFCDQLRLLPTTLFDPSDSEFFDC